MKASFQNKILSSNASWKYYMERSYMHNRRKIAKNLGLLYGAKQESLIIIYFSYIHSYLHYANVAWASTYYRKLKTI